MRKVVLTNIDHTFFMPLVQSLLKCRKVQRGRDAAIANSPCALPS